MTTYEKIKDLCEKSGFSVSSIGQKIPGLAINRASVTGWKNGAKPRPEKIKKIADYFGVSVEYLTDDSAQSYGERTQPETAKGTVNIIAAANIFPIKTKKVPLLGNIACGEPIFAEEQQGEFLSVSDDLDVDFCLRAVGDSMIGARIRDGDVVFIRSQPEVNNGQIAAVLIGDEATLKRVYYYPEKQKLVLSPENPDFEPLMYVGRELEEVRILGLAVAFQSRVK